MYINDKKLEEYFHCHVVSFGAATMECIPDVYFADGSYRPILAGNDIKPAQKELILDFVKQEDFSNFAAEVLKPFSLDLEDGYFYECILLSKDEQDDGFQTSYTCTYTMYALKKKALLTHKEGSFMVMGNYEADCMYELRSPKDIALFEVDGMIVRNLKAEVPLIIDGIQKLVYYQNAPDISAMEDIELLAFPKLKIEEHEIKKSDEAVEIIIRYYPMFL